MTNAKAFIEPDTHDYVGLAATTKEDIDDWICDFLLVRLLQTRNSNFVTDKVQPE